jgi:putative transposase
MYTDLEDMIKHSAKPIEVSRAIAVKQDLAGKKRSVIASILDKTEAFISKWRLIYDEYGVNGLMSIHIGGKSKAFLNDAAEKEVLLHIKSHEVFGPKDLMEYLKSRFGVEFKSLQSYYDLLHESGMSWHKSQKTNPRRNEEHVTKRRKELKKSSVRRGK